MAERRADTRSRIQAVALALFAEQGYDKTSLREIAERLGVTKAALYYHFRTKDDIVASLFTNFRSRVDEIIEWARGQQEMNEKVRAEVIRRYADVLSTDASTIVKFVQGNQSAVRDLEVSRELLERFKTLSRLLTDPRAPLKAQLKHAIALPMLHVGYYGFVDLNASDEDRRAAALDLALVLVTSE